MKLGNLPATLGRELRRSPKKAVVLGMMCLVALYYWVPLIGGWLSPADEASDGRVLVVSGGSTPGGALDAATAEQFSKKLAWHEVARLIEEDPRMQSAELNLAIDPFRGPAVTLAAASPSELDSATPLLESVTPQSLGLELVSTVVGGRRRTATINDQSFALGATVRVTPTLGAPGGAIEFRLAEIRPGRVTLERQGETFTLELKDAPLNQGDWVVSHK